MSSRSADKNIEEADRGHQELNRLYEMAKQRIEAIKVNGVYENRQLVAEVKEIQNLLRSMQSKVGNLKNLANNVSSRVEKVKIDVNVNSHEKQLNQLQRNLRDCSIDVRKEIAEEERKSLFVTKSGEKSNGGIRRIAKPQERSNRLQDLVSRMSQQVEQGEQAMGSLVHSSTVLGQTNSEYENQAGHIQTASKLLSKYEQREFTEKILLFLAILLYFAVVYYILQKRVLIRFWIF